MKKTFLLITLCYSMAAFAQPGYEIKVTCKPFKNQYIYLGHYFGKQLPIIDSVKLDANSYAVFKGTKKLPGGVYLVGYPNKSGFFEILIDEQQHFSAIADTATARNGVVFKNSSDNSLFSSYQQQMSKRGLEANRLLNELKLAKTKEDSSKINSQLKANDSLVRIYRETLIKNNPTKFLSALLIAMREPELKGRLANPINRQDSLDAYTFYKQNYWNGVQFWDGRLAYSNFFESKIEKYYNQLVTAHPDSIIKAIDYMMSFAVNNAAMSKLLLVHFVNRYIKQKYMFEDAVFVHLYEKYFAHKDYPWLPAEGRTVITNRAFNLMQNITGKPAAEIILPDRNGTPQNLYADTATLITVLCFWDPACGHCKEVLPRIDSIYQAKWKAQRVRIFAVAKETDGKPEDWTAFIDKYALSDWTNVYYSKETEKQRIDNNIPGYSQLFDVQSFPTLYLLDKGKRIVAKKLNLEQMDQIIELKLQEKPSSN